MIDLTGAEDDVPTRPGHRLHGCRLAGISDHGRGGQIYLAGLAVLVLVIVWGRYITGLIVLLPALTVADPRRPEATNRPRPNVGGRDAWLFCCHLDPAIGRRAGNLFHLSVSYRYPGAVDARRGPGNTPLGRGCGRLCRRLNGDVGGAAVRLAAAGRGRD